jgi:hypothetical protein
MERANGEICKTELEMNSLPASNAQQKFQIEIRGAQKYLSHSKFVQSIPLELYLARFSKTRSMV